MYLIPESRALFIQSCIDYLRRYDMNGISIRHSFHRKPFFKKYFPILLQDIMDAFQKESERTGRTRLLLYVFLYNYKENIDEDYDVPAIFRLADIVIVDTKYYSFFPLIGNWTHRHQSRLYGNTTDDELNMICKKLNDYQRLKGRKFRYPDNCPFYFYDNDRYLVYYDDAISLISKVRYAKEMGLAGVNIWDVSDDDMAGECGDGPFPLLHHVSQECRKP
uniref:GH18 domain-containing protein n=1 Tax=Biomphalaria glabrata TaxID=6526 RepID=A0A2C9L7S2_BIOGL